MKSFFTFIGIGIVIIIGFKIIQALLINNRIVKEYRNDLLKYPSIAMCRGKYVSGIPSMIPASIYQILADENQLTIFDIADSSNVFSLNYSKINTIRFTRDETAKSSDVKLLVINCMTEQNLTNIIFETNATTELIMYNGSALHLINIAEYVTELITKDSKTVEL